MEPNFPSALNSTVQRPMFLRILLEQRNVKITAQKLFWNYAQAV